LPTQAGKKIENGDNVLRKQKIKTEKFSIQYKNKNCPPPLKIGEKIFCFMRPKLVAQEAAGWDQKSACGFSLKKVRILFKNPML
jgi:hypothetical protein